MKNPFIKWREGRAAQLAEVKARAATRAAVEVMQNEQWEKVCQGFPGPADAQTVPSNLQAIDAELQAIRTAAAKLSHRARLLEESRALTLARAIEQGRAAAALSLSNVRELEEMQRKTAAAANGCAPFDFFPGCQL